MGEEKMVTIIALSLIAGFLYRAGGSDWANTKYRDFGVPIVMLLAMWHLKLWHWSLIPSAIALFASLTTYFKKKGADALWWNWALVGLITAFSMVFYAWASGHWLGFWIRCALNTVLIMAWSEWQDEVNAEEGGRGFIIIATLPLLLIGG